MSAAVSVALVSVCYNAEPFIGQFLASVFACDTTGIDLQVTLIDNGSADTTVDIVARDFPQVQLLLNPVNNYAAALNLGIAHTDSDYVLIANNDGYVDTQWMRGLVSTLEAQPQAGAAQSKIFFAGTELLNSVGVEEIEDCYFRDLAFEQPDSARYQQPAPRDYVTGGSVMLRRRCLQEVGPWDERFIMYMEDVDYSIRCRQAGWTLLFAPDSLYYHRFHGSASDELCDYFCARNRLLLLAKHRPESLADGIRSSHFYAQEQYDLLFDALLLGARYLCTEHSGRSLPPLLEQLNQRLVEDFGATCAAAFFRQLELQLGLRDLEVVLVADTAEQDEQGLLPGLLRERYGQRLSLARSTGVAAQHGADILVSQVAQPPGLGAALRSVACAGEGANWPGFDQVLHEESDTQAWLRVLEQLESELKGREYLPSARTESAE